MSGRDIALKSKQAKYQRIAMNSILVTIIKLCSWIPSGIVFILSVTGHSVTENILTFVTVGVIPINSISNPLINPLTLLTPKMTRIICRMCSIVQNKWCYFRVGIKSS